MLIKENISGLCAVNAVDLEIVRLHREDDRFQEVAESLDASLKVAKNEVARLEATVATQMATCQALNEALANDEAASNALEAQLVEEIDSQERYQKIAREQDIVLKRIDMRKTRKSDMADELMRMQAQLQSAQEALKTQTKEVAGKKSANTREKGRHEENLAALRAKRVELAAGIDPVLLAKYDRAAKRCGNGMAVVRLRGNTPVCSGCNMSILSRTYSRLLSGNIEECGLCHRLIFAEKFLPEDVSFIPADPPKSIRKSKSSGMSEGDEA